MRIIGLNFYGNYGLYKGYLGREEIVKSYIGGKRIFLPSKTPIEYLEDIEESPAVLVYK